MISLHNKEQLICNQGVRGSNPLAGTNFSYLLQRLNKNIPIAPQLNFCVRGATGGQKVSAY
jgi:hypothetical protein